MWWGVIGLKLITFPAGCFHDHYLSQTPDITSLVGNKCRWPVQGHILTHSSRTLFWTSGSQKLKIEPAYSKLFLSSDRYDLELKNQESQKTYVMLSHSLSPEGDLESKTSVTINMKPHCQHTKAAFLLIVTLNIKLSQSYCVLLHPPATNRKSQTLTAWSKVCSNPLL